MTSFLLDTHVWIWLVNGDPKLKPISRDLLEKAYAHGALSLSAISVWETSMLVLKRRVILNHPTLDWVKQALRATRCELIDLSPEISVESCQLPNSFIGDPADRIIIATARLNNLTLLTHDKNILDYGKHKYVTTVKV